MSKTKEFDRLADKASKEAIKEISNATERPNIMPTYEELGSKLTHAINRYHGGFQKVAKKCTCTFECANAINTVYDPKHWISLI